MPLFNKCPKCGRHPMAVGCKPLTIGQQDFEEWYCGGCGHCVGMMPAPTGVVSSTRHAEQMWNLLVRRPQ
jgi:TPP-dependent indolepyruvate ferredoxin oxidoreductase alpha subunit